MSMEAIIMRMRSVLSFSLPVLLAAPSFACGGSVSSEPAMSASSAATKAPVAQSAHGPVKLIGDALGDVALTSTQRSDIEQLASDAEARHAGARAAGKEMMLAFAAQIEEGSIHRDLLQPKIDAVTAALTLAQPADRAAFQKLHDLLQPDQRAAFVDAFEARVREHMRGAGEGGPGHAGPMWKQWAADLALTDAQKDQIRTALSAQRDGGEQGPGEGRAAFRDAGRHAGKMLEAFKADNFTIDQVAPARDIHGSAAHASDRFLRMAEAALPVLTAPQRAIAAQKLRDRADATDLVGPASL